MDFPRPPSSPPPASFRQDAELVAACLAGDREAFVEIVQRHQSLVCAVGWEQTGRLAVSEEIARKRLSWHGGNWRNCVSRAASGHG